MCLLFRLLGCGVLWVCGDVLHPIASPGNRCFELGLATSSTVSPVLGSTMSPGFPWLVSAWAGRSAPARPSPVQGVARGGLRRPMAFGTLPHGSGHESIHTGGGVHLPAAMLLRSRPKLCAASNAPLPTAER